MRTALRSTVLALKKAHKRHKTLDAVLDMYDIEVSKGTLSRILRSAGGVSFDAEQKVRLALGVKRKRKHYRRPCLSDDAVERLNQLHRLIRETEADIAAQI